MVSRFDRSVSGAFVCRWCLSLSGADFDSDTVLLTDNEILIRAAKRNYHLFKTPTSFVSAQKVKRYYTPEQQADLDIKTSVNLIGAVINLSQELNSLFWDRLYNGSTYEQEKDLYYDICQLNALSNLEINLLVSAYGNVRTN